MKPLDRDAARLWDMLDASRQVISFSAGLTAKELQADRRTAYAVERALEIVGEAARRVSEETRSGHPEIPWSGIIGFRHVLAHEHGAIDYLRLFTVIKEGVPTLIESLEAILASIGYQA